MVTDMVLTVQLLSLLCFSSTFSSAFAPARDVSDSPVTMRTSQEISCSSVKQVFTMKKVEADIPDNPVDGSNLRVCESRESCCTPEVEAELMALVRKDFRGVLHQSSHSLEGLLATTASKYQDYLVELTRRSENTTSTLFGQVYRRIAAAAQEPIASLYADLAQFLHGKDGDVNLEDSVSLFFSRIFPSVYHHTVNPKLRNFRDDYKDCLRATQSEIQPFGENPKKLSQSVARTFGAARVLFQSIQLGIEVLNTTDHIEKSVECHAALLRMSHCAKCQGLVNVKPCSAYCLNVVRGCLASVAELDVPWNGYVDATERLFSAVREKEHLNVEDVIRNLGTRVSQAIMFAMENGPALEKKVKRACGHPQWSETAPSRSDGLVEPPPAQQASAMQATQDADLADQLRVFASSLTKSTGFYANLADLLCKDESFAESKEAHCWNGQRVGEYTKTIAGTGLSAQKYNPEYRFQKTQDIKIAQLSDKLRHMRQVVLSQLTPIVQSESFMMDEGSGSGQTPYSEHWSEDDDKSWEEGGSGSGDPPEDGPNSGKTHKPHGGNDFDLDGQERSFPGDVADKPSGGVMLETSWAVMVVSSVFTVYRVLLNG